MHNVMPMYKTIYEKKVIKFDKILSFAFDFLFYKFIITIVRENNNFL